MFSGSGEHVNSTHSGEVTRQTLCLILGDPKVQIRVGEMHLDRYFELGTPFALTFERGESGAITFTLEQLGKPCAEIASHW